MKLQDIKSKKSFSEQYKPGMTLDVYSPDAIKNALVFLNKKIIDVQARITRLEKERDENNGEWQYPSSAEAYQQAVANLQDLQSQAKKLKSLSQTVVTNIDIENLWNRIKVECSDYLEACSRAQTWLYRGMGARENRPAFLEKSPEHRTPVDSDQLLVKSFDQSLQQLGFAALRHNSIFCSSNRDTAGAFGHIYVVFPRNGFDFTYTNEREIILDELEQVLSAKYIESWHRAVKNIAKQAPNQFPLLPVTATAHQMWFIIQKNKDKLLSQGFPQNLVDNLSDPAYIEQKYQPQKTQLYKALKQGDEVYVRGEYYALRWDFYRKSLAFWMNEIQKAPISEQQQTTTNTKSTILAIPTELDQWSTLDNDMSGKIRELSTQNDPQQLEKVQRNQLRLHMRMSNPDLDIMPLTQRAWEEIQQRCSNILSIMKETNEYLWHGSKQLQASTYVMTSPTNRLPKDSSLTASKVFNYALEQLGFKARRDNSLFVTSKRWLAKEMGPTYIILPWDNQCDFTYTNEVDLVLDSASWDKMIDDNQVMMLWQKWKQIPDETKNELIVWEGALHQPGLLFTWLIEHEHNTQTLKKLQQATGMSTRWQDYVDLAQFQRQFQPSKTDLKSAMESYVEIYLSGKFYALRAEPHGLGQGPNWWKILEKNF